ncbi:unnamed protein product [Mytilus coruscus]|uniref:Uncharacterized protein n=1 Tax=Mytilus coruscus TaxID=42192 RepID=A0A6J8EML2_MYTCO|nr:unnamed protein product [Mytilus coruscus]
MEQTYNNPGNHKNKTRLSADVLDQKLQGLYDIKLNFAVTLSNPRYKKLNEALESTLRGVQVYIDNLTQTNERQKKLHQSLQPARSIDDGTSSQVKFIKGGVRTQIEIDKYKYLEEITKDVEPYQPVFTNDVFPIHRKNRFDYITGIKLSYNIEMYTYHPGARSFSLWFCWKSGTVDPCKTNAVVHKIESSGTIPSFHTRAMRKEFMYRFSLTKISPAIMTQLYQYLTGDQSVMSAQASKDVQARLKLLLDTQDPDIVYDLRNINEGRPESFTVFWEELDKYLNEQTAKAVDDRRHGTVCHSGIAMSVPDLRKIIKSRLPENVPVPSIKWLFLQFQQRNPYQKSALHFTGRFNLKFKVQSRQFNIDHQDAHYAAAVFRYLKEFCIKFKEFTALVCVDDKASIPIGEPGVPMATVARGKQTIVQGDMPFMVADHDTATKCKIVPSTILIPDIPNSIEDGSFYRGTVCTILKDSLFSVVNPLRHSAEIRQMLGATGNFGKPIRVIYSDGGPDYRVTYPSVQLALVALFLIDDLRCFVGSEVLPFAFLHKPCRKMALCHEPSLAVCCTGTISNGFSVWTGNAAL